MVDEQTVGHSPPAEITPKELKWLKSCIANAEIFRVCGKKGFFSYIIDSQGRVAGSGYNGTKPGALNCIDGGCPRFQNNVPSGTPYDYGDGLCLSSHAETNALIFGDSTRYPSSTLFVNGIPCIACARNIAGAGIARIVCLTEPDRLGSDVVRDFLVASGVTLVEVEDA